MQDKSQRDGEGSSPEDTQANGGSTVSPNGNVSGGPKGVESRGVEPKRKTKEGKEKRGVFGISVGGKRAHQPLVMHCHRLMDAFIKSDCEQDFYLDALEGMIICCDWSKGKEAVDALFEILARSPDRYFLFPKLTMHESRKMMEGFVQEKVCDTDTKERLMEVLHGSNPRESFLECVYENPIELEKWHKYYRAQFRIKIIEWLCEKGLKFVFEEDLSIDAQLLGKVKENLLVEKVPPSVESVRKALWDRAKVYYSKDAIRPRPKRGRPPKQSNQQEEEVVYSRDVYVATEPAVLPFLYLPEIRSSSPALFSSRIEVKKYGAKAVSKGCESDMQNQLISLQSRLEDFKRSREGRVVETSSVISGKTSRIGGGPSLSYLAQRMLPGDKKEGIRSEVGEDPFILKRSKEKKKQSASKKKSKS